MKRHLGPTLAEVKTKPGPTLPCPVSQCSQLCWQGHPCTCVTLGEVKDCDGGGSPKPGQGVMKRLKRLWLILVGLRRRLGVPEPSAQPKLTA